MIYNFQDPFRRLLCGSDQQRRGKGKEQALPL
jgi:hypothetical protein